MFKISKVEAIAWADWQVGGFASSSEAWWRLANIADDTKFPLKYNVFLLFSHLKMMIVQKLEKLQ